MKKLFAILLATAMLCSFACIGASALTPEEELQAQGEALLRKDLEIFDTKKYTLYSDGEVYTRDGDLFFFEDQQWTDSFLLRWLFGSVERELITSEQSLWLFSERKCYVDATLLMLSAGRPSDIVFNEMCSYFGSTELLDYVPVKVTEETDDGKTYLAVTLGDTTIKGGPVLKYYYLDGQLKRIYGSRPLPSSLMADSLEVESLVPSADLSQFNTKGMFKIPAFLFMLLATILSI